MAYKRDEQQIWLSLDVGQPERLFEEEIKQFPDGLRLLQSSNPRSTPSSKSGSGSGSWGASSDAPATGSGKPFPAAGAALSRERRATASVSRMAATIMRSSLLSKRARCFNRCLRFCALRSSLATLFRSSRTRFCSACRRAMSADTVQAIAWLAAASAATLFPAAELDAAEPVGVEGGVPRVLGDELVLLRLLEAGLADMAMEGLLAEGAVGRNLEPQGLRGEVGWCCEDGQTMGRQEVPPPPLETTAGWRRQALPGGLGLRANVEHH